MKMNNIYKQLNKNVRPGVASGVGAVVKVSIGAKYPS